MSGLDAAIFDNCWNTGLSGPQYEQISIYLDWDVAILPDSLIFDQQHFGKVIIKIYFLHWIALFLLADILLQTVSLFQC